MAMSEGRKGKLHTLNASKEQEALRASRLIMQGVNAVPYVFRLGRALAGLCLALLLVSCSRTAATPEIRVGNYVSMLEAGRQAQFQQVQAPTELVFPLDHQAHPQYGLEWWYFTGNLTSDQGHEYGYQLTFFRIGLARADDPRLSLDSTVLSQSEVLMAHFAITNVSRQAYYSQERFGRSAVGLGGIETRNADVFVYLDDWQARINDDGGITLTAYAHDDDAVPFAIDLTLSANGPPLLHGQDGFSRKGSGAGQANFYYSLVQLNTQGQLQLGADAVNVAGVSWFDHEWGTSSLPVGGAGWDWFGLQWPDGSALMMARVRLRDGSVDPTFVNTYLEPSGRVHKFKNNAVEWKVDAHWRSAASGIRYPSAWTVVIPAVSLACDMEALSADQEFRGFSTYWEGAVAVACEKDGAAIEGRGYAELTGYRSGAPS